VQLDCLSVKLVEDLHQAVQQKVPVGTVVAALKTATLPGLLEYGCLRWLVNDDSVVPPLPPAVLNSPLGQAVQQVRSELGPRRTGREKQPLNRVDTQPSEFHVLDGEAGLEAPDWEHFGIRFARSAEGVGFAKLVADGLNAALHEMAENAVIHSESPVGPLAGYQVLPGVALFTVVDVGIGVLASLRSHRAYQQLRLHRDALRTALQDGASRFGPGEGGFGFRRVFKALADQHGHLRFRSGQGCITMQGTDFDADLGEETFPAELPGFQVTVCCRTCGEVTGTFLV
jgi:hypothetical protein